VSRDDGTHASELMVKVDVSRVTDPAAHVAAILQRVAPGATAEDVFPGLRDGARAGLVTVRGAAAAGTAAHDACVRALTADPAIRAVHEPKSRRPR